MCVTISPRWGVAKPDWTVIILPCPLGGEASPVLFRGRLKGESDIPTEWFRLRTLDLERETSASSICHPELIACSEFDRRKESSVIFPYSSGTRTILRSAQDDIV